MAERSTVALIGSESLLGREVRDVAATSLPVLRLRLIAEREEHAGTLTSVGDEPALVGGLTAESLQGAAVILLAGSEESGRQALEMADEEAAAVIDLTYAAEERPEAVLRAPAVEPETEVAPGAIHVIAHPAAIAAALLLRRLQASEPIQRSVLTILAPASELGAPAVEELQQQTVSLLSFKGLPKAIFDAQLSFNLLARYGDEAPVALERTELRIERHLATLLALAGDGEGAPMPSLRVIQAPVFHGYSISAWVEFAGSPGIEAIEDGLAADPWIEVRGVDLEPPTNTGHAGQNGIAVGGVAEDRNNPDACWFWLVADNLRLTAENAVAVARQLL